MGIIATVPLLPGAAVNHKRSYAPSPSMVNNQHRQPKCATASRRPSLPNVYFSAGASTTAASVVSNRKVKVSCK